jgi:hypothetical protein
MTSAATSGPNLIFIFGPPAVGKMTVGQHLARLTCYRLLYNHMVTDLVTDFFEFGTPGFHRLARPFTLQIIEACADAALGINITHGLIFNDYAPHLIAEWSRPYRDAGGAVHHAELTAPLETRLHRNGTENRQQHKKLDWATDDRLREMESWGAWSSEGHLPADDPHITIDNTTLTPEEAARRIQQAFALPVAAD